MDSLSSNIVFSPIPMFFLAAALALLFHRSQRVIIVFSFALAGVASILEAAAGAWIVGNNLTYKLVLPIGLASFLAPKVLHMHIIVALPFMGNGFSLARLACRWGLPPQALSGG